jgi:hypothetical protein
VVPKVKDYIAQSQEIDDHHDAIAFKKKFDGEKTVWK